VRDVRALTRGGHFWAAETPGAFAERLVDVLAVVPEEVVHPGLPGGWWFSRPPVPRRTPDEAAR
jgi:hypothetical protein